MTTFSRAALQTWGSGAGIVLAAFNNLTNGGILVVFCVERAGGSHTGLTISDNNSGVWNKITGYDNLITDGSHRHASAYWWRKVDASDAAMPSLNITIDNANSQTSVGGIAAEYVPSGAYDFTLADFSVAGSEDDPDWDGLSSGVVSVSGSDLFSIAAAVSRTGTPPSTVSLANHPDAFASNGLSNSRLAVTAIEADGQAGGTFETVVSADGSGNEGTAFVAVFQDGAGGTNATAEPGSGDGTGSGEAPGAGAGAGAAPGAGGATGSGDAPTATTASDATAEPGTGDASGAGEAPSAGAGATAEPGAGDGAGAGAAPTADAGQSATADTGAGDATGAGQSADAAADSSADTGTGDATGAGQSPSVTAGDFGVYFTADFADPDAGTIAAGNAILDNLLTATADVSSVPHDLGALADASGIFLTQAIPNNYNGSDWQGNAALYARMTGGRAAAEDAFKPKVFEDNDFFGTNALDKFVADAGVTQSHVHVVAWHRVSAIPADWYTTLQGASVSALETQVKDHLTALKAAHDTAGVTIASLDVINEFFLQTGNQGVDGWRYNDLTQDDKGSPWVAFADANYAGGNRTERIYALIADLVTWTKAILGTGVKAVFTDFDALHPDHPLNPTVIEGGAGNYQVGGTDIFAGFGDLQTKQHRVAATARRAAALGFDAVGMQAHLFANRAFSFDGVRRRCATYKAYGLEVYLLEVNLKTDGAAMTALGQGSDLEGYFCANHLANFLHACGPHLDGIVMWTDTTDGGQNTGWTAFGRPPAQGGTSKLTPIWFGLAWYLQARSNGLYDSVADEGETVELNRAVPWEMTATGTPSVNVGGTRNADGGSLTGSFADLFPGRDPAADTTTVTWSHAATATGTLFVQSGGTHDIEIIISGTNDVRLSYNGTSVSVGTAGNGRNRIAICQSGGEIRASLNGGATVSVTASDTPTAMWLGGPSGGVEDWTVARPRIEMVRMFSGADASNSTLEPETYTYNPGTPLPDARTVTANANAAPGTGDATGAGAAPSADAAGNATATPGVGTGDGAGAAPTSSADSGAAPGAGDASGIGADPTADATGSAGAAPGVGDASGSGAAPTASGGAQATPGSGDATGAGDAPSADVTGSASAAPGAGGATGSGVDPAATGGATAEPGPGDATGSGSAPSADAAVSSTAEPGTGDATGSGDAPSVDAGVSATSEPGAGDATGSGHDPDLTSDNIVTPGTGGATGEGQAATASRLVVIGTASGVWLDPARAGTGIWNDPANTTDGVWNDPAAVPGSWKDIA